MICYGGPLDGRDIDRADPVYVHTWTFLDAQGEHESTRFYRYVAGFCAEGDYHRPGYWPTETLRSCWAYRYEGECTTVQEANRELAPAMAMAA